VVFTSVSVPGGDTNTLELSTNAAFTNKISSDVISSVGSGGQTITYTFGGVANVNLRAKFPTLSPGQPVYYRLAVKNSVDSPGPVIPINLIGNPTTFSNGSSYIYSITGTFTGS
jgi:hypothetical protein